MPSAVVSVAAGLAAVYVFLRVLAYALHDAKEPPVVAGPVPFIGHVVGMFTEKAGYLNRLGKTYNHPMFTLQLPGKTMYVVNDLRLLQRMDRNLQNIAFAPVEFDAVAKVVDLTETGKEIIRSTIHSKDGLLMSYPRKVAAASAPGDGLDAMNRDAVNYFAKSFDAVAAEGRVEVDLFDWLYSQIFTATTRATYGPQDPMSRNGNYRKWLTLENGIPHLVMDLRFLAKKALEARDALAEDFKSFFNENKHREASLLLQLRRKHFFEYGLSEDDAAQCEIGHVSSFTTSSARVMFWMIWQILSEPEILKDCKREVSKLVQKDPKTGIAVVDLARVKTDCPILEATYREVLRFHTVAINGREIQEDTLLDGQYLLKKGATVVNPVRSWHRSEAHWGPTANQFNHRRFLSGSGLPTPASAYRPFGAGAVLCPGRHFVSTEILSFTALLLLRFDVRPVGGKWFDPGRDNIMTSVAPTPVKTVKVELVPRSNEEWRVLYSDNGKTVSFAEEDLEFLSTN